MAPRSSKQPHTSHREHTHREPGLGYRLTPGVKPTRYRLHIRVAPEQSKRYEGDVEIEVTLAEPSSRIVLHTADLRIGAASIEAGVHTLKAKVTVHAQRETIELALKTPIPRGKAVIRLHFTGKLRADLRGLYAARAGEKRYAFTQLEAADARRFFPCFDEPSFKAVFELKVTTSLSNSVLSNAPIERIVRGVDDQVSVTFAPTPLLSTYLVALAVGPLESSEPVMCGKTPIRVYCVPGNAHLTEFALEAARECLARLERYFGVPYPYNKLDLVAVPDFEIGAMENAGAVFFRETLLIVDPKTITMSEKKRAAEVICHELAHMWYGNLVTMAWWDDLWLNEAFATWMAFHIVDQWRPEWRMWNDFGHSRSSALQLDALRNTHPIYTTVRTPEDATENFDLITYEKGASVVRMLERYLGPKVFREGVRRYIRTHREGNTVASDLWEALSAASGNNVEHVVRPWIEQAGFPLLRLRRGRGKGKPVMLWSQERFHADAMRLGKGAKGNSKEPPNWPIPWVGRVAEPRRGKSRLERSLLTGKSGSVSLDHDTARYVYGNAEEGGFFRPLHAPAELARLSQHAAELLAIERLGLVSHQWALVQAGYAPIDSFLSLTQQLGDEQDADVLAALAGGLYDVVDHVVDESDQELRGSLQAWMGSVFARGFDRVGWHAAANERDDVRLRRAELVSLLGEVAEWQPLVTAAGDLCEKFLADRTTLEANLADPIVRLGARVGDRDRYDTYLVASLKSETPQERRRFRMGLADFRDPALLLRTCRMCLTEDVPTQDVALLLARLLGNRYAKEATWAFIKTHWPKLKKRMPTMLLGRLVEATPALGDMKHARDVAAFFEQNPIPTATRALRQALERFKLQNELRKAAAPRLRAFLKANARATT